LLVLDLQIYTFEYPIDLPKREIPAALAGKPTPADSLRLEIQRLEEKF